MSAKYFAKKVWLDGYCFDSEMEAEYYQLLKEREKKGNITLLKVHPSTTLQSSFTKNGKDYHGIYYEADFAFIDFTIDGSKNRMVDIKGYLTDEFLIKQKLFEKLYPEMELEVLAKDIDGQFKPIDEVKKARKERKKVRKANKKEKEWLEYDTLKLKPKRTPKQEARLSELSVIYATKKHRKVKSK